MSIVGLTVSTMCKIQERLAHVQFYSERQISNKHGHVVISVVPDKRNTAARDEFLFLSYRSLIIIIKIIMCYDKFSHIFRMNYNGNLQCTGTGLKGKQTKIDVIIICCMNTLDPMFLFS